MRSLQPVRDQILKSVADISDQYPEVAEVKDAPPTGAAGARDYLLVATERGAPERPVILDLGALSPAGRKEFVAALSDAMEVRRLSPALTLVDANKVLELQGHSAAPHDSLAHASVNLPTHPYPGLSIIRCEADLDKGDGENFFTYAKVEAAGGRGETILLDISRLSEDQVYALKSEIQSTAGLGSALMDRGLIGQMSPVTRDEALAILRALTRPRSEPPEAPPALRIGTLSSSQEAAVAAFRELPDALRLARCILTPADLRQSSENLLALVVEKGKSRSFTFFDVSKMNGADLEKFLEKMSAGLKKHRAQMTSFHRCSKDTAWQHLGDGT